MWYTSALSNALFYQGTSSPAPEGSADYSVVPLVVVACL
jgi:hypothetical protein